MDTARRESGSIVLGWLTKLIVVFAVAGVALFDVVSLTAAHLGASDDANTAAEAASADYRTSHDVDSAYQAAVDSVTSSSETIPARQFSIDPDGTVHLVLLRTTTTLLVHRIGPLEKYAVVTAHGEGIPPTL